MSNPSKYLTVGTRTFDKFHIIEYTNPNAGFCNIVSSTLNYVRKSLENNWLPVVYYGQEEAPYYYDPEVGDNVWEYYFDPVMGISYARLKQLLKDGDIPDSLVHRYATSPDAELARIDYITDPDFIFTFWLGSRPDDAETWMAEKRQLGRDYVSRFINIKPHILSKVEDFYNENITPQYTIGAHIRGTDFGYAEPTRPEMYFQETRRLAASHKQADYKIFLATDQKQFVDMATQEFGERVITYDSIRSSSDAPVFRFKNVSGYKKGEDVLIDILLLSKCDYLLKGVSSVGEYAMWFNPSLECTDFALDSDFHWDETFTIYEQFNIGQLSTRQLKRIALYKRYKFAVLEPLLEIGRKIIPFPIRDRLWKALGRQIFYPESDAK